MANTTKMLSTKLGKQLGILYNISNEERSKLQATLLSMLVDLKNTCESIGVEFVVMGGSALGAVRHNGFIPWDDDLDVAMTRHDWNIFCAKFENSNLSRKYELDASGFRDCDPKFVLPKLCLKDSVHIQLEEIGYPHHNNIYLDIFIIDNVSDNLIIRTWDAFISNNIRFISNSVAAYIYPNKYIKQVMSSTWKTCIFYYFRLFQGCICRVISHKKWCEWFHHYVSRHNAKKTKLTTVAMGLKRYKGETLEREIWFPYSKGVFEGITINLPHDVDKYLTRIYGNYMKLPPIEERGVHPIVELKIPIEKHSL